ncbi:MAG TPA: class I SAM-dependent rRNA methyltransferase [Polyangiaceae bacterium]|jgi:23S rRNA (cytosine1962-C5)-methyltransferase|nr:class I SAM-dependent rRNA methyltransferase [Polyangiaceae bacterium]
MRNDDSKRLPALLAAAHARRAEVREVTTAYRLVDDVEDGFPGLTVDVYGAFAAISIYEASAAPAVAPLARALVPTYARGVYVKHHERSDLRHRARDDIAPAAPAEGEPAPDELVVEEHGARFAVWLADGLSTGLFTDQRDNRRTVRAVSRGARVLNLFSYTCSFTVAAALGGAVETVSVDLSNRALERGRANLLRNELSLDGHRFLHEDALVYLSRAERRGERFGVVVVDPPSFGTRGKKTFSVERDYGELARLATSVLAPGGRLLAVTNHRKTTPARLRELVLDAVRHAGSSIATLEEPSTPRDHVHRNDGVTPTKSVLVTLS